MSLHFPVAVTAWCKMLFMRHDPGEFPDRFPVSLSPCGCCDDDLIRASMRRMPRGYVVSTIAVFRADVNVAGVCCTGS